MYWNSLHSKVQTSYCLLGACSGWTPTLSGRGCGWGLDLSPPSSLATLTTDSSSRWSWNAEWGGEGDRTVALSLKVTSGSLGLADVSSWLTCGRTHGILRVPCWAVLTVLWWPLLLHCLLLSALVFGSSSLTIGHWGHFPWKTFMSPLTHKVEEGRKAPAQLPLLCSDHWTPAGHTVVEKPLDLLGVRV